MMRHIVLLIFAALTSHVSTYTPSTAVQALGGWRSHRGRCFKALTDFTTTLRQAQSMCRWYGASLAAVEDEGTFNFLVEYLGSVDIPRYEYLPADHPIVGIWWTSGYRSADEWYWPSGALTFSPWLQVNETHCSQCFMPHSAANRDRIAIASWDGVFGFGNVPHTNDYDVPYPLCEKLCKDLV